MAVKYSAVTRCVLVLLLRMLCPNHIEQKNVCVAKRSDTVRDRDMSLTSRKFEEMRMHSTLVAERLGTPEPLSEPSSPLFCCVEGDPWLLLLILPEGVLWTRLLLLSVGSKVSGAVMFGLGVAVELLAVAHCNSHAKTCTSHWTEISMSCGGRCETQCCFIRHVRWIRVQDILCGF